MIYKVSVVICTYNRDKFIKGSLTHLVAQDLPKEDYEILVVNNNCTDQTASIVNQFIKDHPDTDIRMVDETNQGLSFARNRGIKEAQYDIICYIDDDGNAVPNYLSQILDYFKKNPKVIGLGGRVIPDYETEEPAWYSKYLRMMVTSTNFGDQVFKCHGLKYPAGCSMIYTKKILEDCGGFNNDLKWRGDDKYIFQEVSRLNKEIYHLPFLHVYHRIDKARLSDENFDRLSGLLGSEERLRILGKKKWAYPFKLAEVLFKYGASIVIAMYYTLKGQAIKGKYVIRFRWLVLLKFLGF